jgi:hypothetical protein
MEFQRKQRHYARSVGAHGSVCIFVVDSAVGKRQTPILDAFLWKYCVREKDNVSFLRRHIEELLSKLNCLL